MTRCRFLVAVVLFCTFTTSVLAGAPAAEEQRVWPKEDARAAAVRKRLNERIKELNFDEIELKDVLQFLRDVSNVSIYVNWSTRGMCVGKNTTVKVHLQNVTLDKALRIILEDVGAAAPLDYVLDEGVITVSTRDDLVTRTTTTKIYDISDLVVRTPGLAPPRTGIPAFVGPRGKATEDDGAFLNNVAAAEAWEGIAGEEEGVVSEEEVVNDVINILRTTIAPDSWQNMNGIGIQEFGGRLVVTQTLVNHRQIAELFAKMRASAAARRVDLGVAVVGVRGAGQRAALVKALAEARNVLLALRAGTAKGAWSLDRCAIEDTHLQDTVRAARTVSPTGKRPPAAAGYDILVRPEVKMAGALCMTAACRGTWPAGANTARQTNSHRLRLKPGTYELVDVVPADAPGGGTVLVVWMPESVRDSDGGRTPRGKPGGTGSFKERKLRGVVTSGVLLGDRDRAGPACLLASLLDDSATSPRKGDTK